jgi:superfamily I DNA and/or RNA helicase
MQQGRLGYRHSLPMQRIQAEEAISSLLDVSGLTNDNEGKILLTTQYRVPRDIANILNSRIYHGVYNTAPTCQAPLHGFRFVDVRRNRSYDQNQKYVNKDEVRYCIELVRQSRKEYQSFMILTPVRLLMTKGDCGFAGRYVFGDTFPLTLESALNFQYKKQQRQLQFEFKKAGFEDMSILTIDQCQGQEADVVIISLVQKPTRFLNKNRFNVALSRVRQRLYLLTDEKEFRRASQDSNWECHWMAQDLLQLAGKQTDDIDGW